MRVLPLADVAAASTAVAAVPARTAKIAALAELLGRAGPGDVATVVSWLSGELTQRQIGVGYALLREPPAAAADPSLTVGEVEARFTAIGALGGKGSTTARREALAELLGRATAEEQAFLVRLLIGDLRQGALAGVMTDAVAKAAGVPATAVRGALTLRGDLAAVATVALAEGRDGLAAIRLEVGRPLSPMLAGRPPTCRRRWPSSAQPRSSTPSSTARACRCTATATRSRCSRARSTT